MKFILYIDNDEKGRVILKRNFSMHASQFQVISFTTVDSGIKYLNTVIHDDEQKPDMVIADNSSPFKSGFDLVRFVKLHEQLNNIPLVIISNSEDESDIEAAYNLGIDLYLEKPLKQSSVGHILGFLQSSYSKN